MEFGRLTNQQLKKGQKVSFFNANFLLTITELLTKQALDLLSLIEHTTKDRAHHSGSGITIPRTDNH